MSFPFPYKHSPSNFCRHYEIRTVKFLVKETYRQRFGIETTYRQLRQARIRTCTKDPLLRFLYIAIALILRNVWVWLHWAVLSQRSSVAGQARQLCLSRLRLRTLLAWMVIALDDHLRTRAKVASVE